MNIGPRRGSGQPLRLARRGGDAAVEACGDLQGDPGAPIQNEPFEGGDGARAVAGQGPPGGLDPGVGQLLHAAPRDEGVWIDDAGEDARNPGGDERVGARWGAPMVAAGLQRDVDVGTPRGLTRCEDGHDLGVRVPGPLRDALADDATLPDHDAAHEGVGARSMGGDLAKLERAGHEARLGGHVPPLRSSRRSTRLASSDTNSLTSPNWR